MSTVVEPPSCLSTGALGVGGNARGLLCGCGLRTQHHRELTHAPLQPTMSRPPARVSGFVGLQAGPDPSPV